ncbi:MAG TPA: hypothetical protein VI876_00455 [Dehalococcoidia bacterium]|nr:hypothetical protein [Dehalococcoidia bacterium]
MTPIASTKPAQLVLPSLRFFRTPKGILIAIFAALAVLAIASAPDGRIVHNLLLATAVAAALDLTISLIRRGEWLLPDGAILTGAIVAFILRPQEADSTVVLAVTAAIASKHLLRTRWSNVLNPAAAGLVVSGVFLGSGQSWWGALPDVGILGLVALGVTGYYLADHTNKLPMILAFFGAYLSLFTIAALFGQAGAASEIFRTPDAQAALFFAFFMLDDPPTSPVRYEDQVVYGLMVATLAYLVFMTLGAVYYLPAALLIGNAWESGRRLWFGRGKGRLRSNRQPAA